MQTKIIIGKKYEVKPANFHRNMVGVATAIHQDGVTFQIDHCDICDRSHATTKHGQVTANFADVKQQVGESCFFS